MLSRFSLACIAFVLVFSLHARSGEAVVVAAQSFGQPTAPKVMLAEPAVIHLSLTQTEAELTLAVTGEGLSDVYAYDFLVEYDSMRLKFTSATSALPGFSVEPIERGNTVRLAHTKVGAVSGITGAATFATLNFERIRGGAAVVTLRDIKLVDTGMNVLELAPKLMAVAESGRQPPLFSDISGHWAETTIIEAAALGFVDGYADGTFRPQNSITRNELAALLVKALLLSDRNNARPEFADSGDIPDWAVSYVISAAQSGLIEGYDDRTFRGGNVIVRQELAAMAVRAIGRDPFKEAETAFSDNGQMQSWVKGYVAAAEQAGLMHGKEQNRFAPLDMVSRAEAATVALRLIRAHPG